VVVETESSAPIITKFNSAMILNHFQQNLIMKILHSPVVIFNFFVSFSISLIIWWPFQNFGDCRFIFS